MQLAELVTVSGRIAATRARNEKIALLADLLRRLEPREVPIGVAYLSGHLRQGRIGLGWAALRSASESSEQADAAESLFDEPAASGAPLNLADVDQAFERIAAISGAGSAAARTRLLRESFRRAGTEERRFLVRLVT